MRFLVVLFLLAGIFLFKALDAPAQGDVHHSSDYDFKLTEIASGLEYPWGMAFLPDGRILVTEREGRLRIIKNNALDSAPIEGLPDNIFVAGQGGLLDVALHPDFEQNQFVYISYAAHGESGAGTEVSRGRLMGHELTDVEVVFSVDLKTSGQSHYGSRLLFDNQGFLFITTGDRYFYKDEAQNVGNHLGTIVRLKDDGAIPEDNPFITQAGAKPEIYTYGHRNSQGIALHPDGGTVWAHEHGPRGGDEVNILRAGANYGWPAITYGIDYSGAIISDQTHAENMEQPVIYWDPSIAPSGMTFYNGQQFPKWKGNLFVGALVQKHLRRLIVDNNKIVEQEVLLKGMVRIRDVKMSPEGALYILTDDLNGKLLRLDPQ